MRVLRQGLTGEDVEKWQNFLRGRKKNSRVITTGIFDALTLDETKDFQRKNFLSADGVVGPMTLSTALKLGMSLLNDDCIDVNGPNWPSKPDKGSMSYTDRLAIFGKFDYVASATSNNPEGIRITDNWAANNIVSVILPQLKNAVGAPRDYKIQAHKKVAKQLTDTFRDWETACLIDRVKSWGGSWVPRFIRGSRTNLSNHAWGTAFDINVPWNLLGTVPALKNDTGSVRELVEIAYNNGFYWGGWFPNRLDGMHFEAYKVL